MDLGSVNKTSSQMLAFLSVSCSGMAGIYIERGIEQLIHAKSQFDWISSFLLGSAFLVYGIFDTVMLVRRTDSART